MKSKHNIPSEANTCRPRIIFSKDDGLTWRIHCFHHPAAGTLQQRVLTLRSLYPAWLWTIGYQE